MSRKGSSLILLTFLVFLTGAKNLTLGFCLCEQAFFIGQTPCGSKAASCCASCGDDEEELPCEDCIVALKCEVDDFFWSHPDMTPPEAPIATTASSGSEHFAATVLLARRVACSRAPNPPPPLGPALLIRQCRYLL